MFQSIVEIQRISTNLDTFKKDQSQLRELYTKSKTTKKQVDRQISHSITHQIQKAKRKLEYCQKLEYEVQNQQFIHGEFIVQDILFNVQELPEWFNYVFEKQFDKNRSSLSSAARRLYQFNGLHQKKQELANQIHSFEILHERYRQITSRAEQGLMNIDREAESFQNRVELIVGKFVAFVEAMTKKIVDFAQQNADRSLKYTEKIHNFAEHSHKLIVPPREVSNYELVQRSVRQGYSIDKFATTQPGSGWQNFKAVNSPQKSGLKRSPSAQMSYLHDQYPACQNHGPANTHAYFRNTNIPIMSQTVSRFNYRDHMPKYTTAATFLNR